MKNITKDQINYVIVKYKKQILFFSLLLVLLLLGILFVRNNYMFYRDYIVRVTNVNTYFDHEEQDENGSIEKYYQQKMKGILLNGEMKGKTVTLTNNYGSSLVYDNKYKKGDELFVQLNMGKTDVINAVITGVKRDYYIALLVSVFIFFVLLIAKKKGFFTLFTLGINLIMFSLALDLYLKGTDIIFLSILGTLFYTIFSLLFISGLNKKTFTTILATLISVGLTILLFKFVLSYHKIDYASMEYLTMPNDVENIFMAEIIIGGLGAIMDIAITMAAAFNELIQKNPNITTKALLTSGREIGNDIMGTMINVFLFTFLSGSIPFFIIALKNGIHVKNILSIYMPYEIYRFLTGSIGILISIPISILLSILILKKRKEII